MSIGLGCSMQPLWGRQWGSNNASELLCTLTAICRGRTNAPGKYANRHAHARKVCACLFVGVLNISDILLQWVDFLLKLIFSFRHNLECAYRMDGRDMQQHMLRICVYRIILRSIHSHPLIHPPIC